MPSTHVPIFAMIGQIDPSTSNYLIRMTNAITRSAFRPQTSCSVTCHEHADRRDFYFDASEIADPLEPALRVGETLLQTLGALSTEIGIRFRLGGIPVRPALQISGLTRYQLRLQFVALLASIESPTQLELTCCRSALSIRLWAGGSTGAVSSPPSYLCEEIVRWRSTSRGDVVRIRVGKRFMSIALPADYCGSRIKQGSLISTLPIVGLVPKRLVQTMRCQFSVFD